MLAGRMDFVLEEQGKTLPVSYVGTDPLPDTFVDKSQALVEGRPGPRRRFVAEHVRQMRFEVRSSARGDKPAPAEDTDKQHVDAVQRQ